MADASPAGFGEICAVEEDAAKEGPPAFPIDCVAAGVVFPITDAIVPAMSSRDAEGIMGECKATDGASIGFVEARDGDFNGDFGALMTDEMTSAMSSLDREAEMAGAFVPPSDLRADNLTPLADAIDADVAFLLLALLSDEPAPTPDDLDCSVIRYKLEGVSCVTGLPGDEPLLAALLSKVRPDTSDESDGAMSKATVDGTLNSRAGKSFLSAIVGLLATAAASAFPAGSGDGVSAACAAFWCLRALRARARSRALVRVLFDADAGPAGDAGDEAYFSAAPAYDAWRALLRSDGELPPPVSIFQYRYVESSEAGARQSIMLASPIRSLQEAR